MPLAVLFASLRRKAMSFVARHGVFATASIALLHLAAAAIMLQEGGTVRGHVAIHPIGSEPSIAREARRLTLTPSSNQAIAAAAQG